MTRLDGDGRWTYVQTPVVGSAVVLCGREVTLEGSLHQDHRSPADCVAFPLFQGKKVGSMDKVGVDLEAVASGNEVDAYISFGADS